MFNIAFDAGARLLRISLEGFWSKAAVEQFAKELEATIVGHRSGAIAGAIIDARQLKIQSLDVVALLKDRLTALESRLPGRAALIVPIGLVRLQGQRVFPETERFRIFATEEEGRAWVLEA